MFNAKDILGARLFGNGHNGRLFPRANVLNSNWTTLVKKDQADPRKIP